MSTMMALGDPITFSSGVAGTSSYYNADGTYFQTDGTWVNGSFIYRSDSTWQPIPWQGSGTAGTWTTPIFPQPVAPAIDEEAIEREVARRLQERGVPVRPFAPLPPPLPTKKAPSVDVEEAPKITPRRVIDV